MKCRDPGLYSVVCIQFCASLSYLPNLGPDSAPAFVRGARLGIHVEIVHNRTLVRLVLHDNAVTMGRSGRGYPGLPGAGLMDRFKV